MQRQSHRLEKCLQPGGKGGASTRRGSPAQGTERGHWNVRVKCSKCSAFSCKNMQSPQRGEQAGLSLQHPATSLPAPAVSPFFAAAGILPLLRCSEPHPALLGAASGRAPSRLSTSPFPGLAPCRGDQRAARLQFNEQEASFAPVNGFGDAGRCCHLPPWPPSHVHALHKQDLCVALSTAICVILSSPRPGFAAPEGEAGISPSSHTLNCRFWERCCQDTRCACCSLALISAAPPALISRRQHCLSPDSTAWAEVR